MNVHTILSLLKESIGFAWQNLVSNKLRTFLSLLGISIGVFCISAILTFVDSLNQNIRQSLAKLGEKVIYVQKWPWSNFSDYPWWEYVNRPQVSYQEKQMLEKRIQNAQAIAFNADVGRKTIKSGNNTANNVPIRAVSQDFKQIYDLTFQKGRYFSQPESSYGSAVTILGHEIASNLFPDQPAVDQEVRFMSHKLQIIGVLEKEGQSMLRGGSMDRQVFVPVNFARKQYRLDQDGASTSVLAKAKPQFHLDQLEQELRGAMRSIRRIKPKEEGNFALNRITLLTSQLDNIFQVANIAGWFIAAFSILIGGFGVANIMFVSVKERTPIIGIQKAIGAQQSFILVQFLTEAIVLCIFGGVVGLSMVGLLAFISNSILDFQVIMTFGNVLIGIALSALIGILAGFIPAYQASRMDPIEAIRYAM